MAGNSRSQGFSTWWNRVLRSISGSMELPPDVVLDVVRTTLIGTMQIHVENHKGVAEYTPSSVRIRTRDGTMAISGAGLKIGSIYRDEIVIDGRIESVHFERGRPGGAGDEGGMAP